MLSHWPKAKERDHRELLAFYLVLFNKHFSLRRFEKKLLWNAGVLFILWCTDVQKILILCFPPSQIGKCDIFSKTGAGKYTNFRTQNISQFIGPRVKLPDFHCSCACPRAEHLHFFVFMFNCSLLAMIILCLTVHCFNCKFNWSVFIS